MGKEDFMANSKTANALIFGKRNKKVKELEGILAEHFFKAILVSRLTDLSKLLSSDRYELIVVTDAFKDKLNKDFFVKLKRMFPDAKMLCLFDKITQEVEVTLRSVGIVFLGSYDQFGKLSRDILQSALKSKKENS